MKSFKKLLGSKDKANSADTPSKASTSNHPLAQPILAPAFYGHFPATFTIYFSGHSQDKKSDFFVLASNDGGHLRALNAITIHKGLVKHQLTLHSGPDHGSSAICLAGNEKSFRSQSVIAMPAASGEPGAGSNQMVPLMAKNSLKFDWRSFDAMVGFTGVAQHSEAFEWKSDNSLSPPTDRPFEHRLSRMNGGGMAGEEVVGTLVHEPKPENEARMGTFYFQGSGATGELGPYWTLLAVMTLLRVLQSKWEASAAADSMIKAAGKMASAGIGFAV